MGSTLVTNGHIRSQPVNDNYRNGYTRIEENNALIRKADAELEEDGIVSVDTLTDLTAAGLSIDNYT